MNEPWSPEVFVERLRAEGASRYHDGHPFNVRMHEGQLAAPEIRRWVLNRYYYQTRIPIKDAIILSKSDDPSFRRRWIRRIGDHDGSVLGASASGAGEASGHGEAKKEEGREGGLFEWLLLARSVGLDEEEVRSCRSVLPAVRYACDAYVDLVRRATLVEAVASSLTESFAPDIMRARIAAWEKHYPWIDAAALSYFRSRVPRATRDAGEAIDFVTGHARTRALQDACVRALVQKCQILWGMLDAIAEAVA